MFEMKGLLVVRHIYKLYGRKPFRKKINANNKGCANTKKFEDFGCIYLSSHLDSTSCTCSKFVILLIDEGSKILIRNKIKHGNEEVEKTSFFVRNLEEDYL
jgi:hypothetical protein